MRFTNSLRCWLAIMQFLSHFATGSPERLRLTNCRSFGWGGGDRKITDRHHLTVVNRKAGTGWNLRTPKEYPEEQF
uniref:Putative secreted protein n=1 Tax=Anopheles darlingi TaxID=43151 RepID=A0A2M4DG03_ANODA